jgi:hypothetical protein
MYRGICAKCNTPVTDIGDRFAAKWIHDEGRQWLDHFDHAPVPTAVTAA